MTTAKKLCLAILALLSGAAVNAASLTPSELERAVFLSMTLDPDYDKSRIGVRILSQRYPQDDEICDHVAEKALKAPASTSSIATDAISWYVRTLSESCNPRYNDTLALVRQRQTHEKIVKFLDLALAKPATAPAVAQYKEGTIDLLAAQLELMQMLSGRQQVRGSAAGIAPGSTLGEVLGRAGIPRELAPMTLRIAKYGRKSVLAAHYDGTGLLMFTREGASQWVLADVLDELAPVGDLYKGPNFGVAQSLATLRGQAFRLYVKAKAREVRRDRELLWVLTQRVANSPFASDKFEADGLMVAVEVIAGSRHPEAVAMLKTIAASPGEDVPKRAGAYAEKLERQGPPPATVEPDEKPDAEEEAGDEAKEKA
jgi:hypothetical protein